MKRLNDHAYLASTLDPAPYKKDEAERAAFATIALWMFAAAMLLVAVLALGGCEAHARFESGPSAIPPPVSLTTQSSGCYCIEPDSCGGTKVFNCGKDGACDAPDGTSL